MTQKMFTAYRGFLAKVCLLLLALVLVPAAIAQETTAGVEGTVKDKTGATIGNATVTLSGEKLIGVKTIQTDSTGYYRFANIDPGTYTITVVAPGFTELKKEGIQLQTGRLPSIDLSLAVGSDKVIVEVTTETPQIDITSSLTQTNVSREEIDYAPRGRSFQSVIGFAPGARNEPLQGGFQIDGAATSENSYLIEGQETGSMVTGKSSANAPFEFIQEVQIKTSGIDAENGGAMGGVVNAIQKRGANKYHGSVFTYYEGDPMDASPATTLRYDPLGTYCGFGSANPACASTPRLDFATQNYTPIKDHFRIVEPGVELGGYLKRDRLWMFISTAPLYQTTRRTVNFVTPTCTAAGNCLGTRQFNFSEQTYFSLARLDLKVTDKIRLFGAWQYAYDKATGTTLPTADSTTGQYNSSAANPVDTYQGAIGYVAPNLILTGGADITLTSNLVATTRIGNFYQNYGDRGTPSGDRFLYVVGTPTASTTSLNGQSLATANPSASGQPTGAANIGVNEAYAYNVNSRTSFNQDIAYFKKGFFGTHNFKIGYQLNHLFENVNQTFNQDLVRLGFNSAYAASTTTGQTNCAAISAANVGLYGAAGGNSASCRGNWGYLVLRDGVEVTGKASSNNHSFYAQDAWTAGHGLTLNIGLRMEHEYLPAYNSFPSGIDFSYGSKLSPRIGGAWDVFRNGKMKVFGSYGVFYDVMKLNLAIGSFGGNYWHDCAYALDTPNYSAIKPVKDASGHYCPAGGATTPGSFAGGAQPAGLRFIENADFRIPSNDPSQGAAVDPAIKPYREHQVVMGIDYQINKGLSFESRYTRNRLDHAIEDVGYVGPNGEAFIIANPGEGIDAGGPTTTCPTCKFQPKPARNYDGIEFRITKAANRHWFGQFAYTYSRLRGNYSGLTSTDVSDGGGARANPNNNRSFDEPYLQFDATGHTDNGLLATDRPNSFKAIAYYRFNILKRNETSFGLFQQASSGSPLSSYADVNGSAGSYGVFVVGRGQWIDVTRNPADGSWVYGTPHTRRTPWFIQSDASFIDEYKVSDAHEGWKLGFEANALNLFNHKAATIYSSRINSSAGTTGNYILPPGSTAGNPDYGILENGYDWKGIANSSAAGTRGPLTLSNAYGQPSGFQAGRSIRLKVKFIF